MIKRTWACAEPGCPQLVEIRTEARELTATSSGSRREASRESLPVYVTCPQGHTHRYVLTTGAL